MESQGAGPERAFILGLDGVPWGKLREWTRAGELPAFARLFDEGAAGPLESTTPATTPLAWPSIATGVWPDRHGIYAFQRLTGEYSHRMYTSDWVKRPALWDIVSPAVVGNVPMTYPATAIDGKMVTGMMTPEQGEGFTHPPALGDEIERRIPNYEIGLDWGEYADRPDELQRDIDDLVAARRELLDLLLADDDWRLAFFVFTAPDRLQHLVWDDDVLLALYRRMDDILADVIARVASLDAALFVVSDHGFGPVDRVANVNRILADAGLLEPKGGDGTRGLFERVGVTRERVQTALKRVGIDDDALVQHLPRTLVDAVASELPGDHELYDIDYGATAAFMNGPGTVFVNDDERFANGSVSAADRDRVKATVAEHLAGARDPETGERPLTVYDGATVFPADPDAPDLVVESERYALRTSLADEPFGPPGSVAGDHRKEGILFAWGPGIDPGARPEGAAVVDIAPTVLHALGEPVPESAAGRVLESVFSPDSTPANRPIETRAYDGPAGEGDTAAESLDGVEDRLRGLGYME